MSVRQFTKHQVSRNILAGELCVGDHQRDPTTRLQIRRHAADHQIHVFEVPLNHYWQPFVIEGLRAHFAQHFAERRQPDRLAFVLAAFHMRAQEAMTDFHHIAMGLGCQKA